MFQAVKQYLGKHFAALSDEKTAMNERQAIVNSVKGFLTGLFRFRFCTSSRPAMFIIL